MSNQHLTDFLDYYCGLDFSPEYSILITAEWGAGKTWFINQYINFKEREYKFLYVSLYGVRSYSDIEDQLFSQLHPVLSSPGVSFASKLFKGVVKTTIKVDIDNDGKDDGALHAQVPEIKLPKEFQEAGKAVLVFDDIERCNLPVNDVLGYINYFVEHHGQKVILIANEEKLVPRNDEEFVYRDIKEKLIGRTFLYAPDVNGLIESVSDTLDSPLNEFVKKYASITKEIYQASSCNNLRALKQSIWDFGRLYRILPDCAQKNDPFLVEILKLCVAFGIETRVGSILAKNIPNIYSLRISSHIKDVVDEDVKAVSDASYKYTSIDLGKPLLGTEVWRSFYVSGFVDPKSLSEAVVNSGFFSCTNTPVWAKLWNMNDYGDEVVNDLVTDVYAQFSGRGFHDVGVITHVVGMLFWLADKSLIDKSKEDIGTESNQYMEDVKKKGLLVVDSRWKLFKDRVSYEGLGFFNNETSEFKTFCDYRDKIQEQAFEECLPEYSKKLVSSMTEDFELFVKRLHREGEQAEVYFEEPILKFVDSKQFVEKLLSVASDKRRSVFAPFRRRYAGGAGVNVLLGEISWLREVRAHLVVAQKEYKGRMTSVFIESVINMIDEFNTTYDECTKS